MVRNDLVQTRTESSLSPANRCVCLPGVRRVGDGSHAVLFHLWKGKQVQSQMHVE